MIQESAVRVAIAGLIAQVATTSVVYQRKVMSIDKQQWLALLKSEASSDKVRAWMISLRRMPSKRTGPNKTLYTLTYDITGFAQFEVGTDESNSETEFTAEALAVVKKLQDSPRLGLEETDVQAHDLLQLADLDLRTIGETLVHVATCSLSIPAYLC